MVNTPKSFTSPKYKSLSKQEKKDRQLEIFRVFLKMGTVAFGGPAAHVALTGSDDFYRSAYSSTFRGGGGFIASMI